MGEYTAACVAGSLSLEDALALVTVRGQLFEKLPEGAMLGVPLSEADVEPLLGDDLAIAAVNTPDTCVVSGTTAAIQRIRAVLHDRGVETRRLHISVAAHSALVELILDDFRAFVESITFREPIVPWVSNVSGTWIQEAEATAPSYWVNHLRQTVRFADGLGELSVRPETVLLASCDPELKF